MSTESSYPPGHVPPKPIPHSRWAFGSGMTPAQAHESVSEPLVQYAMRLADEAFAPTREPRSVEYQMGVRQALLHRIAGKPFTCAYLPGTARFDAFHAGVDEGKRIARRLTNGGREDL